MKTTMEINRDALEAVSLARAKQDVRYYLNGVKFECQDDGRVAAIATDGHRLHACIVGTYKGDKCGFIVGNAHLDLMMKKSKGVGSIEVGFARDATVKVSKPTKIVPINGEWIKQEVENETLFTPVFTDAVTFPYLDGSMTVKPIDGKFPEWRRVVKVNKDEVKDCWVYLNPKYMLDVAQAISLIRYGSKTKMLAGALEEVTTTDNKNQVVFTDIEKDFVAVVMPMRNDKGIEYRMPEWVGGE
jgi:DNA polymerase III sliding clamp (beta) subunit (PCNA family)